MSHPQTSSVERVSFSIDGGFMTNHHRDLVREGNWRKALHDLQDSFTRAMDHQMVVDILSGKARLDGVNDVYVVEDDVYQDESWIKDQYFGYFVDILFIEGETYKVYGQVKHLSYDEMLEAQVNGDYENLEYDEFNKHRALGYSRNPSTDRVILRESENVWLLCEPVTVDFPIWLRDKEIERLSHKIAYVSHRGRMQMDDRELAEISEKPNAVKNINSMSSGLSAIAGARLDDYFKEAKKADAAFENLDGLRDQIAKQADQNGGWLELYDPESDTEYKLPKFAFYRWCLSNSSAWEMIDWTPVSPRGMKMGGDDPNHTDWWLFTGHDLEAGYDNEHMEFFSGERLRIMEELTGHQFNTLARGSVPEGKTERFVRHVDTPERIFLINQGDIIIIPTASPDFEVVAHKCAEKDAILITEVGGKLCHLATVGREFGLTLLMLPEARKFMPMGCKVSIDVDKGALEIKDLGAKEAAELKISGAMYRRS